MKLKSLGWPLLAAGLGLLALASPAMAAEKSTFDLVWRTGWRIINFCILAGLLYKVAREPARDFFRGKRQEAQDTLSQLEESRNKAQAELEELEARLQKADQETEEVLAQLKGLATRNCKLILKEARQRAEEALAHAQTAAQTELNRIKHELAAETAQAAILLASEKLKARLSPADHERLQQEALADIAAGSAEMRGSGGSAW